MARRRRPSRSNELFDLVVRNALDFLKQSASELEKRPKYAVINFCSALELFLKARLLLEHWALVVSKPERATLEKFCEGDFRSVSMDETIKRLRNIADEPISREEEAAFRGVREHRNKLVHFFHEQYSASPPDRQAVQDVVSEQCKAWYYLHRLVASRWVQHFQPYASEIEKLSRKMEANRAYLRAKYDGIAPEIRTEIAAGAEYARCLSCGYEASRVAVKRGPLYQATCRVCRAERKFLRVPCPKCRQTIEVEDMGEADCPNEDFTTSVEWLVEKYGPDEDPKEETELAYCSHCERADTPTAIPLGEFDCLCLSCLAVHDSAERCEYCGELNASLAEASYLTGCVMCSGQFGSESFLRE